VQEVGTFPPGLKPGIVCWGLMARLKSCPFTRLRRNRAFQRAVAGAKAKAHVIFMGLLPTARASFPAACKARGILLASSASLKSCLFTKLIPQGLKPETFLMGLVPGINPRPTTRKSRMNPRPTTRKSRMNPRPIARKNRINPRPIARKNRINPRPTTRYTFAYAVRRRPVAASRTAP